MPRFKGDIRKLEKKKDFYCHHYANQTPALCSTNRSVPQAKREMEAKVLVIQKKPS